MAVLFISELDFDKKQDEDIGIEYSSSEYCEYHEKKIKDFVEAIDGAGKTQVIITLSETTEYIYATDDKDVIKNDDKSDDSSYEKDYVIIDENNNDTGLLIKTVEPKIRGVAIACEGGNNPAVQQQIYSAIGAVLNISSSRISISKLSETEAK